MRDGPKVLDVRISHADRLIYPDPATTKLQVAQYYERIAEWIVPHVAGRPLTLVRCPEGIRGDCVYMKHSKVWAPEPLRRVRIQEKTKVGEYLIADDIAAVVGLVQMGVMEIHTWNSTAADVEHPNRIVWDLDPGPNVEWSGVVVAARELRNVLALLGLESWAKTTGGRGLHIVVPIERRHDWSECLTFSRLVAEVMVRAHPARYTIAFPKRGRESKILIDYLRNNRTNTSIAAFSTRARPDATVSMPIGWAQLTPRLRPDTFTIKTVGQRLRRAGADPWRGYWTARQRISATAAAAVAAL